MNTSMLRHGLWNALDHGITRVADAATSIILLWVLAPEVFSKLALSQAWVAPLLVFFVCPEITLYRDFQAWRAEGREALRRRLWDIRAFGWVKLVCAVLFSFVAASVAGLPVAALVWAFAWAVAPQVVAADREYLRMELRLVELNVLSIYQKATFFCGIAWVARGMDPESGEIGWALAGAALFSLISSALLAYWRARRALAGVPEREGTLPPRGATLSSSIREFSTWYHVQGVLMLWVLSMDLWCLGVLGESARVTGLYAIALKIANFAMAAPMAFTNSFTVWLGRRISARDEREREIRLLKRLSLGLGVASLAQWAVLALIGRSLLAIFARGRWTPDELELVYGWMQWILAGGVLLNASLPLSQWIGLRLPIKRVLSRIAIPWTLSSLTIYFVAGSAWGADGVARANLIVAGVAVMLALVFVRGHGGHVRGSS